MADELLPEIKQPVLPLPINELFEPPRIPQYKWGDIVGGDLKQEGDMVGNLSTDPAEIIKTVTENTDKSFMDLTDTPDSYVGEAGDFLKVASDESGVGFETVVFYVTYTFYEHTIAQSAGMGIPATIMVDRACTIDKVYIHVETAPGANKTITVDVNKNGTTIFTTQGNRPSITETSTEDESGTPDVVALAKNDKLTMDIDVHDGAADKLSVYVRCK